MFPLLSLYLMNQSSSVDFPVVEATETGLALYALSAPSGTAMVFLRKAFCDMLDMKNHLPADSNEAAAARRLRE